MRQHIGTRQRSSSDLNRTKGLPRVLSLCIHVATKYKQLNLNQHFSCVECCCRQCFMTGFRSCILPTYIYYVLFPISFHSSSCVFRSRQDVHMYATVVNNTRTIMTRSVWVQTGRWEGIAISDRTCALCENVNEIADEYHYILICPFFKEQRKTFLKKYYYTRPNTLKFQQLMSSSSTAELLNLCKLIIHLNKIFKR